MFSFFAHPIYFYGLIAVLLVISLMAVFSMGEEDRKIRKKHEEELLDLRQRGLALEKELEDKDSEYKETAGAFEKTLQEKDAEFSARVSSLEAKLASTEQLKSRLASLEPSLSQKEEALEKANKELALSNQMYNGLKGQYDELEEKFSQLFEEFLKEQKKNQSGQIKREVPEAPQPLVALPKVPNLRPMAQQETKIDDLSGAGGVPE
jgi:chromosome segregation ATPase